MAAARRHAAASLDPATASEHRDNSFTQLLAAERQIRRLPEKHRARIREEDKLISLLRRAHAEHDAAIAR